MENCRINARGSTRTRTVAFEEGLLHCDTWRHLNEIASKIGRHATAENTHSPEFIIMTLKWVDWIFNLPLPGKSYTVKFGYNKLLLMKFFVHKELIVSGFNRERQRANQLKWQFCAGFHQRVIISVSHNCWKPVTNFSLNSCQGNEQAFNYSPKITPRLVFSFVRLRLVKSVPNFGMLRNILGTTVVKFNDCVWTTDRSRHKFEWLLALNEKLNSIRSYRKYIFATDENSWTKDISERLNRIMDLRVNEGDVLNYAQFSCHPLTCRSKYLFTLISAFWKSRFI